MLRLWIDFNCSHNFVVHFRLIILRVTIVQFLHLPKKLNNSCQDCLYVLTIQFLIAFQEPTLYILMIGGNGNVVFVFSLSYIYYVHVCINLNTKLDLKVFLQDKCLCSRCRINFVMACSWNMLSVKMSCDHVQSIFTTNHSVWLFFEFRPQCLSCKCLHKIFRYSPIIFCTISF